MRDPDRGLLLGDALFETILVRRGVPFRLHRHLTRLRQASGRTGIPVPGDLEETILGRLAEPFDRPPGATPSGEPLSSEKAADYAALRITATRGPGAGLAPPDDPSGRLHLDLRIIQRPPPDHRRPLSAVIAGRVEERSLSAGLKHTGYLERVLAIRSARQAGADEAVLLNSRDRLVEGTASNLFAVRSGEILTPSVEEGALPGITRQAILELAEAAGIPVRLEAPAPDEPLDEIFLTSSLRGPISLVRLGERRFDAPGPVYRELAEALERLIDDETQIAMDRAGPPVPPS